MNQQIHAIVFRLSDDRIERIVGPLDSLGVTPILDPMFAAEPTGMASGSGAFVVLTSKAGVELLDEAGWNPGDAMLCHIGPTTADVARDAGWTIDCIPDGYISAGLVDHPAPNIDGATVEAARSDHGSVVLTDSLYDMGVDVYETVFYWSVRPKRAGESAELVVADDFEAAPFTLSLMVGHLLDAAAECGICKEAIVGLDGAVVGTIRPPARGTTESHGIDVTVIPDKATFEVLAVAAVETVALIYHE